ncbi:ABC transporter substrate-binding protein [Haladaptatus sp. CMAA 1911]|uniref:ABC transporter substrate-binding protein n=1 Tax=unclassified Haladaptatus TaxID=2622732 RepID=UPI0037540706
MIRPTIEKGGISRRAYLKGTGSAGAVGLALLAGCTARGQQGSDSNTLEIVHWWTAGGEKEALQALLDGYKKKYPGIQVQNNPAPGGAGSALDTVIKNRVLNQNPPSTFQIWPGQSLTPYIQGNVLNDIGDSVWTQEVQNAYLESVRNTAKPAGNYVAVPLNIHRLNNLFYNADVVKQAGVDPKSIGDPTALGNALDTVSSKTEATPMAHSTQEAWTTLQLWETVFIGSHGSDAFLDLVTGNAQQHQDQIKQSLRQVKQYSGNFNEDSGSISWDQANSKVINGEAAFVQQGDWAAGQYEAAGNFEYQKQWDYVPFPGTGGVYSMVIDSFVYPKNNPSPDATEKFLAYCASVDAQRRFNPIKGSIPPRTDVPMAPFGPFLQSQIRDFKSSKSQPTTIAHGSAVVPAVKSNMEEAFASFTESWNVDSTASRIQDAFQA